jgi:predicted nucleic-acid-binding protein
VSLAAPVVWLDTNVIIRYITADHPTMTPETAQLMERVERGEVKLKLASIVIAECCWVLQSRTYGFRPSEIANVLVAFLGAVGVEAEEREVLIRALERYAADDVDFVDAYLAEHAKDVGPPVIATFNERDFAQLNISYHRPSD